MEFQVPCQCGQSLAVTANDAGTTKTCDCGRLISIPRLSLLREMSGLSAYETCPADEIRRMVAEGTWHLTDACCHCGAGTDEVAYLHCDCEHTSQEGGEMWDPEAHWVVRIVRFFCLTVFYALAFQFARGSAVIRQAMSAEESGPVHGRDVSCTVRFRLCDSCQKEMLSQRGARRFADTVPAFQRLLKKYPDATFRLLKPHEVVGLNP